MSILLPNEPIAIEELYGALFSIESARCLCSDQFSTNFSFQLFSVSSYASGRSSTTVLQQLSGGKMMNNN
jgi:hypothetical protein